MEETRLHDQEVRANTGNEQYVEALLNTLHAEADQNRHIVPFRPLVDFVKFHTQYMSGDASSPPQDCPICRETTLESHERMLQIELPSCRHTFGADCFERYIQRSHTCPLCREMWFEKRLTPETHALRQIVIEVTVANERVANAIVDRLDSDDGEIMRTLMAERIIEPDDEEDDTETLGSATAEEVESGSEPSVAPLVNTQIEATSIEVTFGASREIEMDTETEGEVSGVSGRAFEDDRCSASDDEAVAPPRQRRRYA